MAKSRWHYIHSEDWAGHVVVKGNKPKVVWKLLVDRRRKIIQWSFTWLVLKLCPHQYQFYRLLDMDVISIVFHFQMSDKCPIHKKYWSSTQSYLLWIIVYDSSYTFIIHHFFTSPDRSNKMTEDLLVWNYIKLCNVSYLTISLIKDVSFVPRAKSIMTVRSFPSSGIGADVACMPCDML